MIKNIFPVNVHIEDLQKSQEWTENIKIVVSAIFLKCLAEKGISKSELGENEIPFLTEENINAYPILNDLREIFIDGFYSLAKSYENNTLTKDKIRERICRNSGKLPFMSKNEYKSVHSHVASSAFAIFYLTNVNNEKDGGKLVLRDPSFNSNLHFSPDNAYEIETRQNRLVVAPGYVWHEVTPYSGEEERITVVINLDFI